MAKETLHAVRRNSYGETKLPSMVIHRGELPVDEASFAMAILERWAMVQGQMDGEDSAGRAKLKLMPIDEAVQRACDISEGAYAAFRARGWMLDVPSLNELEDEIEARENQKENGGAKWNPFSKN